MQPSIGLHVALIILIHGGSLASHLRTNHQDDGLKYIKRKRNDITNSAPEFATYNAIQPKVYHVREKREIDVENVSPSIKSQNQTKAEEIDDLTVSFTSRGKEYVVDLQLNRQLIPLNYFQKYHKKVSS